MAWLAVQPVCEIPRGAKIELKSLYPTVSAIPDDTSAIGWGYLIVKIRRLILCFPNINKMQQFLFPEGTINNRFSLKRLRPNTTIRQCFFNS